MVQVESVAGEAEVGIPSVITRTKVKRLRCDKLRGWRQMFQGDSMQEVDADIELWIRNRNTV